MVQLGFILHVVFLFDFFCGVGSLNPGYTFARQAKNIDLLYPLFLFLKISFIFIILCVWVFACTACVLGAGGSGYWELNPGLTANALNH